MKLKTFILITILGISFNSIAQNTTVPKSDSNQSSNMNTITLTEKNRAIVEAFVTIFYYQKDVRKAFMEYVSQDYIQHNPTIIDGREAAIEMLTPKFSNPNANFSVKKIMVDGDLAVVHLHGKISTDNNGGAVADFYRLKDGKIVEHWDVVQPVPTESVNPHPMFGDVVTQKNRDVFTNYVKAINNGKLEDVMALIADDAQLLNSPYRPKVPAVGKALLQEYISETIINEQGSITPIWILEKDNTVEGKVEVRSNRISKAGFKRILGTEKFTIKNDKIVGFEFKMDVNDAETKQFLAFVRNLEANRPKR